MIAVFKSLLIHISCASSNAMEMLCGGKQNPYSYQALLWSDEKQKLLISHLGNTQEEVMSCAVWLGAIKIREGLTSKVRNLQTRWRTRKQKEQTFSQWKEESGTYYQAARELSTLQDAGTAETSLSLWHSSGCGGWHSSFSCKLAMVLLLMVKRCHQLEIILRKPLQLSRCQLKRNWILR